MILFAILIFTYFIVGGIIATGLDMNTTHETILMCIFWPIVVSMLLAATILWLAMEGIKIVVRKIRKEKVR